MNLKPLVYALAGAGVAVAGTSGAFSLDPSTWLGKDGKRAEAPLAVNVAAAPAAVRVAAATPPVVPAAPVPPLAAGSVPNFRAIVQQAGPAVVGVTVEGTRAEIGHRPGRQRRHRRGRHHGRRGGSHAHGGRRGGDVHGKRRLGALAVLAQPGRGIETEGARGASDGDTGSSERIDERIEVHGMSFGDRVAGAAEAA